MCPKAMFTFQWVSEEYYLKLNTLDQVVQFVTHVLRLDRSNDFSIFHKSTFVKGIEQIVERECSLTKRKDGSSAFDHCVRAADLAESTLIKSFWDSYLSFKVRDKIGYYKLHSAISNTAMYVGAMSILGVISPIIFQMAQQVLMMPHDVINFNIPTTILLGHEIPVTFSPEHLIVYSIGLAIAWGVYISIRDILKAFPYIISGFKDINKTSRLIFETVPGSTKTLGEAYRAAWIGHEALEDGYWGPVKEYLDRYGAVGNFDERTIEFLSNKSVGDVIYELALEINSSKTRNPSIEETERISKASKLIYLYMLATPINSNFYKVETELLTNQEPEFLQAVVQAIRPILTEANKHEPNFNRFFNINLNWRENYTLKLERMYMEPDEQVREPNLRFKAADSIDNIQHPPDDPRNYMDQLAKYAAGIRSIFWYLREHSPGWGPFSARKVNDLLDMRDIALARLSGYTKVHKIK